MSDGPRKLRLLVRGKEKLDSLLHRRKKPRKEEGDPHTAEQDGNSEFEDDTPILSRIKDPSQFAAPQTIKLKVMPPPSGDVHPASPYNGTPTDQANKSDQHDQEEQNENENMTEEQAIKSQRRRGIVGIQELQNQSQPTMVFKTDTVTSGNRAVAMQPSTSFASNPFTFNMQNGIPTFCPFRGLGMQVSNNQPNDPQIQQAARNAFLKSDPQPENLPKESFESTKPGISIENVQDLTKASPNKTKSKLKNAKSVKTVKAKPYEFLAQPMQKPTTDDPLSYLRLSAASTSQKPIIDKARPLAIVSDFVRPEIEQPLPGPAIYRDGRHKPVMPKDTFINSLPDALEITKFVHDAGKDVQIPQTTKQGDVPALTTIKRERVPVRAISGSQVTKVEQQSPKPSVKEYLAFGTGATNLPPHAATNAKLHSVSDTHYTAPDRLVTAVEFARSQLSSSKAGGLKRKRGDTTLPPPSYVHQRTNNPNFNILTSGILCYPELTLLFASHLPVQTLINLYSISKDFHIIINQRFTTVVLNQLRVKAPCAAKCYPWRCYTHLCQSNPSLRAQGTPLGHTGEVVNIQPPGPAAAAPALSHLQHNTDNHNSITTIISTPANKVPTFRYLRMAIHREKVIHELYAIFAEHGVPLPGCPATYTPAPHEHGSLRANQAFAATLHKLWFLFDIPDNGRRVGYLHSGTLFTNTDLLHGLTFLVKLDMVLHDPLAGEKRDGLRKLLLSARDGFDTLLRVLKRDAGAAGNGWNNGLDVLRAWARYGLQIQEDDSVDRAIAGGMVPFNLTPEQRAKSTSLFGIPRDEVGLLKREFWGALDTYQRGGDTNTNASAGKANPNPNAISPPSIKRRVVGRPPGYLMRIDQLLLRESIRRKLAMNKQFLRSMLHGYVDPATLSLVPVREYGRRSDVLEEMGEYDVEGLAGGLGALKIEEGGDALLDLGEMQSERGSALMIKRRGVGEREMAERKKSEEARKGMYAAWKAEVEREQEEERQRKARKGVLGKGCDGDGDNGFWW